VVALCCPGPAGYTTWIDQLPGDTQVNSARLWQKPDVRRTFDFTAKAATRGFPPPTASRCQRCRKEAHSEAGRPSVGAYRKETKRRSDEQDRVVYLFTLDSYWTLDGAVGGSGAEYFNHCCDPNIVAVIRQGHILYLSRQPIQRGEELTFDYHFAKDVPKVYCCCGATACRGTINLK
jgi:hypothetical protein